MMAAWMLAATMFAVLLGVAAMAAERAARALGREGRLAWIAALVGAVSWPAAAPLVASVAARFSTPDVRTTMQSAGGAFAGGVVPFSESPSHWSVGVNLALCALWSVASLVLLARLAWATRVLARVERTADREVIDGVPVLVTPSLGPAVFGTRRARVLVPRWLLEFEAPLRALVLRHEQEHCRARDPQVTLAIAIAEVLMPWNAGIWWIARRLKLAVELDCDQRVLRQVQDPERYSQLLLFIAQRQSLVRLAPMLAESNSHLSRRITAMHAQRPSNSRRIAAGLAAVAVIALALSTTFASELTAAPKVSLQALKVNAPPAPAVQQPDRNADWLPGAPSPRYPDILKQAGVEGGVLLAFVVDTNGLADPSTIKILRSTHQLFANSVIAALPNMRFRPAVLDNVKVKQAVRAPILFNLVGSPLASADGQLAARQKLMEDAPLDNFATLGVVIVTGIPK